MINSFLMISTAVRAEHAPSRSIGNCMSSVRAPSLKVSRSMPHNSHTLRTLMCGCACHHAFLARGLLLCAAGAPPFSGVGISRAPLTRLSLCSQTTSEVAGRLVLAAKEGPERERRHRSASVRAGCDIVDLVVCRTVREAVECRASVRVVPWTYGTGQASIVPVPCTYGVGLGAPAVSRKVIVTSAFDICRVGDTVVSGRRKTGQTRYTKRSRTVQP